MSGTASSATTRPYGVKLVCRVWEQPRSSYYAYRRGTELPKRLALPGKRGPKTVLSDAQLLEMIRADLETSPFQGEGHRKVWARLRVRDGVKVGRRRVLRLIRENNLLSPSRGRRGHPTLHEGEIITQAPNVMWGTDGARVFTVEEGWGLALRGGGALERLVRGLACLQTGNQVCGPGAHLKQRLLIGSGQMRHIAFVLLQGHHRAPVPQHPRHPFEVLPG